jgi:putative oxidoreductase
MSTVLFLELSTGFLTALIALWFIAIRRRNHIHSAESSPLGDTSILSRPAGGLRLPLDLSGFFRDYFLRPGPAMNAGLLVLRLAIGAMMIHHGQDKLANPQSFADTYVAPLHLPAPLLMAYLAGFSEVIGSWMVILGIFTPLGAAALTGTMTVAAYHHILTSGLNIYVLELVILFLAGSVTILLIGPGRYSFDASIVSDLIGNSTGSTSNEAIENMKMTAMSSASSA